MIRLAAALSLLALPAAAQTLSPPEAATLPRVIATACLDLAEVQNGCEQVILLASEVEPDTADLIVLTDWRTTPPSAPLLIARGIVFNGPMWGMAPSVEQAENGSLLLHSGQGGIGGAPWAQTLTLAWRDGGFIVAGYTWSAYIRASGDTAECDVNLITGDYSIGATRAGAPFLAQSGRIAPMAMPAAHWVIDTAAPAPCSEAARLIFED